MLFCRQTVVMSRFVFELLFIGLIQCSFGSAMNIIGTPDNAVVNEDFTFTCSGSADNILINLNVDNLNYPVRSFTGANAGNGCSSTGAYNTSFRYSCSNDSNILTYNTTIPYGLVIEQMNNSKWSCENPFVPVTSAQFTLVLAGPQPATEDSSTTESFTGFFTSTVSYHSTTIKGSTDRVSLTSTYQTTSTNVSNLASGGSKFLPEYLTIPTFVLIGVLVLLVIVSVLCYVKRTKKQKLRKGNEETSPTTKRSNQPSKTKYQNEDYQIDNPTGSIANTQANLYRPQKSHKNKNNRGNSFDVERNKEQRCEMIFKPNVTYNVNDIDNRNENLMHASEGYVVYQGQNKWNSLKY